MKFATFGTLQTQSGKREEVINILTRHNAALKESGCISYEVGANDEEPDTVFVTELWESAAAHKASLQLPAVKAAIAEAMPMLTGHMTGQQFSITGSPLRDETA